MINHGGNTAVGPHIESGFNGVDHCVEGQNHAHEKNRHIHARQERGREKKASHGHAGIADGGQRGDENPDDECAKRDVSARILHEINDRQQNKGCAAIHIDCCTDREHKSRNGAAHAKAIFCRGHGDGKRPGRRL